MKENNYTIKQFFNFISEGKLKGLKCKNCGNLILPPRIKCSKCGHKEFEWIDLSGKGKLLTYTVIYVPPKKFKEEAPYAIGVVELDEGVRLEARISGVDVNNHTSYLKTGMPLFFDVSSKSLVFTVSK